MLLVISFLSLATIVSGTTIDARAPADVLIKLQKVDAATRNLTSVVNAWDGTKDGASGIWQVSNMLAVDILSANSTLSHEAPYSCTDSNITNAYLTSPLEPDTLDAMNAFATNKVRLNELGFKSTVVAELYRFRQGYMAFFKTYATKVCAAAAKNESAIMKKIDNDIAYRIREFTSA